MKLIILASLLFSLALAVTDLSTTQDSELSDMFSNNWYNLLPANIKNTRTELLKLL